MNKAIIGVLTLWSLAMATSGAYAADASPIPSFGEVCHIDTKGYKKDEWKRWPKAESSVTQHHFAAGGKAFDYTATAGTSSCVMMKTSPSQA